MSEDYIYKISDDQIKEAKEKNPDCQLDLIAFVLDDGRTFEGVFKKPTPASFQRYLSASSGTQGDAGTKASLQYIRDNIVFPTFDTFFEIQKDLPAIGNGIGNKLAEGMGIVRDSKKKIL